MAPAGTACASLVGIEAIISLSRVMYVLAPPLSRPFLLRGKSGPLTVRLSCFAAGPGESHRRSFHQARDYDGGSRPRSQARHAVPSR